MRHVWARWVLAGASVAGAACASSCGRRVERPVAAAIAPERPAPTSRGEVVADLEPGAADLLPLLRQGAIDVAGPVVDFGEPQAQAFLQAPLPLTNQTINGDSWASVGPRVRLRVAVAMDQPPTVLRLRVRHANARRVVAFVDGLLGREAALPAGPLPAVVTMPMLPDRFRRDFAEVELRFVGAPRAVTAQGARVVTVPAPSTGRGGPSVATGPAPPPPRPAVEIDWFHLARDAADHETPVVRTSDLVADVRIEGPPRRALTFYAPTRLTTVTVIPEHATFRAALAAEGVRGGPGPVRSVTARVLLSADGVPPVELVREVTAGAAWQEVALDLGALAGRATRVSVSAEGDGATRLAVADPRLVAPTGVQPRAPEPVRHVVFVVVRGARFDRFVPALSTRYQSGGFARLLRESLVARATAPAPHELAALASVVTGIPADVHRMTELTDTLDDEAPTLAVQMDAGGVATAGFSDDQWFFGSGLDRGLGERGGCAPEVALCRAEAIFRQATEWLVRHRDGRSFALVVTRAGVPPLDPPLDLLNAFDPNPPEGAPTPDQSAFLAMRSRRGSQTFTASQMDRLVVLYDAAMAGVDRGLALLLDGLRDAGMQGDTVVILAGDRGTALGESGYVGDGPTPLAVSQTVLMVRVPGLAGRQLGESASVLDAAATALERLGVAPLAVDPGLRAGAVSLLAPHGNVLHARGVVLVDNPRADLGLAFGGLLALPRAGVGLALYDPEADPLGQYDLSRERPIARAFAEAVLTAYRTSSPDEPPLRVLAPSTRPLPLPVETAYRNLGFLRR